MVIPEVLAEARLHDSSKTVSSGAKGAFLREDLIIIARFLERLRGDARSRAERKVAEQRYWIALDEFASTLDQRPASILTSFVKLGRQNLGYLFRRPTIGLLRRLLTRQSPA